MVPIEMDRLTSMEVFVKAADAGSFALAASELGISAPMVGKHVRQLEEHLGVLLLNRTTRRQSLTSAGRDFLERTRNVLAELEAAEALAAENRARPRGELRVNAPLTFGTYSLARALPTYMAENPDVSVRLSLSDRITDLVDEGFDCVFRVGPLADSALMARALRPLAFAICASPTYLAARGEPREPKDLADHACLGFAGSVLERQWTSQGSNGDVIVPIRPRFSANSGQALRQAALAGLGILLQVEELTDADIKAGRLMPILPGWKVSSRPMHLLFAPDRRVTPKLRSFIDFSVRNFG